MSIESLKNRINKRVELTKYKQDYTDIGSFIKRKRKELNVTQDEISMGICSISYLSKIENNQIIPNDYYVKEIMEKLEIDEAVYSRSLKEKEYLDRLIKAYFYMEDDKVETVYQEIQMIEHNLNINLCKLGHTVYFMKDDHNQYVMMLENLINNMNDYEVKMYLYFSSLYFVQNEKYKTALELIVLSQRIPSYNELLEGLLYELSYYVKQRLLVKNCSNEDYYQAMNVFNKFHNVNRVIHLALHKAKNLSKENPKKALKLIHTIKHQLLREQYRDFYYHTKANIHFNLAQYKESTLALKNISEQSIYYLRKMTLLLQICIKEGDFETIENIKTIVNEFQPTKLEMRSKVHYHYLTQKELQTKKEYLRDIAIPFSIHVEDYGLLQIYTDSVIQICIDTSRYKEATQYYKKYQKEMNKVKRILY